MIKVYVDTSVFVGCFDAEFEEWSNKLIEEFKLGLKVLIIPDLTFKELEEAPVDVKNLVGKISGEHREYVLLN